jgi:tight adherence protein B
VTDLVWLTAAALVSVVAVPSLLRRPARARWRRLLGGNVEARPGRRWTRLVVPLARWRGGPAGWSATPARRRAVAVLAAVVVGAGAGVAAGPVAATVAATYAALAVRLWAGATVRRGHARSHRAAVESVAALAAELRAGQAVGAALASANALREPVVGGSAGEVAARVSAAVSVAESSGAPLADVLDRLDHHLRAADRARATASAQAAGARASALLLAAMPVAGVGLGFAVGVDSIAVLLRTPLGAACLGGAVLLQLGGLAWADRLARVEVSG